ncbi:FKBP-type peptidyl-prolyl cis-trans isomerase [Pedobacter montanisoli]|uniref:Peptidyl-prolyl cis-trans isomerase n=1 Tax=Pedobacter montanisoli TaxID=2923277 RepID=A0ABS9ZSV6_9SPHI|nr:FKBP-type peptidyl-prolyl cis-trans isomerase [Pedobacter montanisoli]MCJ0741322.1 FKBP-type peptidyl-prolyl cis-trans isomerase [Pedobacter montanisoli]
MKKTYILIFALALSAQVKAQNKPKAATVAKKPATTTKTVTKTTFTAKPVFTNLLDSASYAFGNAMASNLKAGGLSSLNYELLVKGLKDAFDNNTPVLNEETAQLTINKLFESLTSVREEKNKNQFAAQIKEGEDFLSKNKLKKGVITTASGLQYEVIKQGTGNKPKATDQVTVHYQGTLLNGFEFDSSYKRGEPISLELNRVIKGWTEGVQLMPEGSKYRFYIPYNLGYGTSGAGQNIPPYATLIFDVELIKIDTPATN